MKKLLHISIMALLAAGLVFVLAFTDVEHNNKSYRNFRTEILNPSEKAMITLEEIDRLVAGKFGKIEGTPVRNINLYELENTVRANPYISKCEVFKTIDGNLEMKVSVREPLVRIINEEDGQFYLDKYGYAMPVSHAHPSHVIIASGNITDHYVALDKSERSLRSFPDSSVLQQIYPVAWFIARDEFLSSFIDQIFINDHKEIELVPKIGSQIILIGNAENVKEKLENLRTFYLKVMSQMDWNVYKTINIKYKNQVVCSKYN
jgi:cell division protein FtsQ